MAASFFQDVRYASRGFCRSPGFLAVSLLVIALGTGANTAIFSIIDAVILRPLPYRDPQRLAAVWETAKNFDARTLSSRRDLAAWQRGNRTFERLAGFRWWQFSQTGLAQAQKTPGEMVTIDFFPTLGVSAFRGRLFITSDLTGGPVAVIGYGLWQSQFGGGDAVGRRLILDGKPYQIIGILPRGFQFYPSDTSIWTLLTPSSDYYRICPPLSHGLAVVGRLRGAAPARMASADLAGIRRALEEKEPELLTNVGVNVVPLQEEFAALAGNLRPALLVLFVSVGFVLLITCANVANLLLGKAAKEQKEIALRAALGCSRWHLIRRMLAESLLLSCSGTAIGTGLAWGALYWFHRAAPIEMPPAAAVALDLRVLLFTAAMAIATGVACGFIPAVQASLVDINGVLKESGRASRGLRSRRVRHALVAAEVAISLILLSAAALLMESFVRLRAEKPGFRTDHAVRMSVDFPENVYPRHEQRLALASRILDRIASLPGVQPAFTSDPIGELLMVEGRPIVSASEAVAISGQIVTPEYFGIMGVPPVRGRLFDSHDDEHGPKVALINRELARRYFGGEDPLGKRIAFGDASDHTGWMTIAGIVGNTRHISFFNDMEWETAPLAFVPLRQSTAEYSVYLNIVARGDPARYTDMRALLEQVRGKVSEADPNLPVYRARSMEEDVYMSVDRPRFRALLLACFALLALVLASVGLYGVLSQAVTQQTQEIGIRMAVGAMPGDVLRMVVLRGVALATLGVGFGIAGSLMLSRILASMLYGVSANNPLTLVAVSVAMVAVAALASFVPAWRATRVDPVRALRHH